MKYLLFDFDGTLADSSKGIYFSFAKACKEINFECPSFDDFRKQIGPPIQVISKNMFPNIKSEELVVLKKKFREDYDKKSYKIITWYSDVEKSLIELNKKNYNFSLVSNKPTFLCETLLENQSLKKYFDLIIGIDYCERFGKSSFQDKSYAIKYALKILNINPSQAIYIGDTLSDMKNANSLGMRFIAARYGFFSWSDKNLPNMYINKFSEIIDMIKFSKI